MDEIEKKNNLYKILKEQKIVIQKIKAKIDRTWN